MIRKILKLIKWVLVAVICWLTYCVYSILYFPVGTLSDSADAAIVLGAAVNEDKLSPVFEERINHAINLYHAEKIKKIIFTGGIGVGKQYAESVIAREYAITKNVNSQDILIETESLTTKQNLINAQQIIKQENIKNLLLISDSMHLMRAMIMAKELKLNIKASATPSSRYQSLKTRLPFTLRELYYYHHYLLFSE